MGKFGRRTKVTDKLEDKTFILLGESGVGKTSTMAKFCEKYYGEDGYIILDIGKEQGMDALDGYTAETCEDYEKFDEVITDIVEHKKTDYPDLKLIIMDTLDQLVSIHVPYVIDQYNKTHRGTKDFKKALTLNAAWGGFGAGEDKIAEYILERVWQLKAVGVGVWFCGHVKIRNKVDPISQSEYSILSTDLSQRIFEAIKTKAHIVGIACIDRTIEMESTGRRNIVTKEDIKRSKIKKENRKIVFRDDSYSIDAKSRFEHIVDEIPLDPDELYKALTDAIAKSKNPGSDETDKPKRTKKKATPAPEPEEKVEELDNSDDELFGEEEMSVPSVSELQAKYKACKDADVKSEFTKYVKKIGSVRTLSDAQRLEAWNILGD